MGIDWKIGLAILGLVGATLLLTGPGMWSEKWGWNLFHRSKKKKP